VDGSADGFSCVSFSPFLAQEEAEGSDGAEDEGGESEPGAEVADGEGQLGEWEDDSPAVPFVVSGAGVWSSRILWGLVSLSHLSAWSLSSLLCLFLSLRSIPRCCALEPRIPVWCSVGVTSMRHDLGAGVGVGLVPGSGGGVVGAIGGSGGGASVFGVC
jgi:hypothetical protein